MLYVLENRRARVTADDFGAQLISVVTDGEEWLWQNEDGSWDGHAPLLFPVCGHFDCIVSGREYAMPPHGFAKSMPFTLEKRTKSRLIFVLRSSETTKQYYPYDFVYRVEYRLRGRKLTIVHETENVSDQPLYFACGGHESYRLFGSLADYKLVFSKTETFVHRPCNDDGYLTGARETLGIGKELLLPESRLRDNDSVILENIQSDKVRLCGVGGYPVAELTFKGFSHLLLWRPLSAKVVCIEPWTNLPDDELPTKKEFSQKSGLFRVEPHEKKRLKRTIKYF